LRKKTVTILVLVCLIGFGLSIFRVFFVRMVRVPTGNMMNTIVPGDHLMVTKAFGAIERGRIVVFQYPKDSTYYISRVVGLPGVPQRASIVFDDSSIDRLNGAVQAPLARAKHIELHGRLAEGSALDRPVIETVLKIESGSVQGVHPLLAEPFDADLRTMLSGLRDFSPKPWPQRFREIQAAGGHVEIVQSRIQQGDLVAVAAGTLGLSAQGRLDGELQMTVAGIEKVIPALGIEKMLDEGVPQATLDRVAPGVKTSDVNNLFGALDRAIPGLGKVVKQNANVGVVAGINALGKDAVLEGKKARAFPLRFVDGTVFLGPLKVAQIPPLF